MEIIELTRDNLDNEHIGCALGTNPDARRCEATKKEWMRAAFDEGYRFYRLDARGKALIETVPGENAWAPIAAEGWLYIECFWVSGSLKGQGHAARLLETAKAQAVRDGSKGLCALAGDGKRPFLSDGGFYRRHGFALADEAPPFFELLALPMAENGALPCFKKEMLNADKLDGKGLEIWYSHHCPHTAKYAGLLREAAGKMKVKCRLKLIENKRQAQTAPSPFTIWAMFYDGVYVTNEIYSPGKLVKFLEGKTGKTAE